MIRSFVAVDLSLKVLAKLIELRRELSATGADVRWVREDGLHCTLKFLGEVEEERLETVHQALCAEIGAVAAFAVRARGIGVFPNPRSPRVVWVGLEQGPERSLAALAGRIDGALMPLGFALEARPFRAHITLGRVRGKGGWTRLAECMRRHESDELGASRIDRVVVYRSDLRRGGSIYTPLWTISLAESSLGTAPEPEREDEGSGN